jgi:fatty acid desaturase
VKPSDGGVKPRKGYQPEAPNIDRQLAALMMPNTFASLSAFASDWLAIVCVAGLSSYAFMREGATVVTVPMYLLAHLIIASRQRALECLIHEGAHFNLSRNRRLNDGAAWLFGALPLLHNLTTERDAHLKLHHSSAKFWTEEDPDWLRYRASQVDRLPADNRWELVTILVPGFFRYLPGTLRAFFFPQFEPLTIRCVRLGFWVITFIVFAAAGQPLLPVLYWFCPFLAVLPVIRFFGEVSEHAAAECSNEFCSTRNNLGFVNEHLIHPRGDGYHIIHHLYPGIPFCNLPKADRILLKDRVYRELGRHCCGIFLSRAGRRSTIADLTRRA